MTYEERTVVHEDDYVSGDTSVSSRTVTARPTGSTVASRVVILLFGIVQVLILLRIVFLLHGRSRGQRPRELRPQREPDLRWPRSRAC